MRTEVGESRKVTYRHQAQEQEEATRRELQNPGEGVFPGTQGIGPNVLNLPIGSPFLNDNEHVLSFGHCSKQLY